MNSVNGDRRLPQISRIKSGIVGGPSILTGYHVIGKLDISQFFFADLRKFEKCQLCTVLNVWYFLELAGISQCWAR